MNGLPDGPTTHRWARFTPRHSPFILEHLTQHTAGRCLAHNGIVGESPPLQAPQQELIISILPEDPRSTLSTLSIWSNFILVHAVSIVVRSHVEPQALHRPQWA